MGDGSLCQCKEELLCLLEHFVISSSVPNESEMRRGMGNPDTVFRILRVQSLLPGLETQAVQVRRNANEEMESIC